MKVLLPVPLLLIMNLGAVAQDIPDLSGNWSAAGCLPANAGPCPFAAQDLPLHPRTRAHMEIFDEPIAPKYSCVQASLPSIVADRFAFGIEQLDDRVIFTYEKDDVVRTVWLEGHGHPEAGPYDFSVQGHSVGRYEGDQLVVETSKFTYDPTGLRDTGMTVPSSTEKRVVERYRRADDTLVADVEVDDPLFLTEPIEFTYHWNHSEEALVLPYGCDPAWAREPLKYLPSKWPND